MNQLYSKLQKYSLIEALKIEESDRQFIALKGLYKFIKNKELFLILIIANSLICYQLSGKGEDYWEEFSEYFSKLHFNKNSLLLELGTFIKQSKNNKRFIDTKIKRLSKLEKFVLEFYEKEEYYYKNMLELRDILAKIMNQKLDAKTIVFAIKMFSYGARNKYDFQQFPKEISIPIDSRLEKLYEKYNNNEKNSKDFYKVLSRKLDIPELHLDAILWVNYDFLIK